jgi:hypothetical protein
MVAAFKDYSPLHYICMSEQEQAQALLHAIAHTPVLVPVNQDPFGMGQSEVTRLMQQVSELQAENESLKAQLSVKNMDLAVRGQKIE